ncbi:hypothetical protein [Sphaerisporangium siamense]|uniref:Putative membrane protein YeaQ/YmgE (Transglycosylase-associated protein family) n=1 Tax=Sphaerisporangium siamense TaxID=795645 RepID=A0A7W7GAD8_9ACTN|nr:hypothetical protein [Sphaerisporangium siamense]MBB4699881.1 putative membrane protein YeaQ/YmgE (transglycosylase-associated protein family) [Sphaerisporangium siamense]
MSHPLGRHRLTLNTDGKRHPLQNIMTTATLTLGVLALVTGFVVDLHMAASWAGVLGFLGGLYAQYISATTAERSLNIVGIVGAFVGAALGIYHGGFIP